MKNQRNLAIWWGKMTSYIIYCLYVLLFWGAPPVQFLVGNQSVDTFTKNLHTCTCPCVQRTCIVAIFIVTDVPAWFYVLVCSMGELTVLHNMHFTSTWSSSLCNIPFRTHEIIYTVNSTIRVLWFGRFWMLSAGSYWSVWENLALTFSCFSAACDWM